MEAKKHYIVYRITNLINGNIYIGQHETFDPNDKYMGSGELIKRAIKIHGVENFKKEILFDFDTREDMNKKESELVNESFVRRADTYNMTIGGSGKGYVFANEHNLNNKVGQCYIAAKKCAIDENYRRNFVEKISRGVKEYYNTHSGSFTGRRHTDETKRKLSIINSARKRGANNNMFGKHWFTNLKTGKFFPFKSDVAPEGWIRGRIRIN